MKYFKMFICFIFCILSVFLCYSSVVAATTSPAISEHTNTTIVTLGNQEEDEDIPSFTQQIKDELHSVFNKLFNAIGLDSCTVPVCSFFDIIIDFFDCIISAAWNFIAGLFK